MRMTEDEYKKLLEDAEKLGFVTAKGVIQKTAYVKFLLNNVKVDVKLKGE
jgi:hypothetical protein